MSGPDVTKKAETFFREGAVTDASGKPLQAFEQTMQKRCVSFCGCNMFKKICLQNFLKNHRFQCVSVCVNLAIVLSYHNRICTSRLYVYVENLF